MELMFPYPQIREAGAAETSSSRLIRLSYQNRANPSAASSEFAFARAVRHNTNFRANFAIDAFFVDHSGTPVTRESLLRAAIIGTIGSKWKGMQ
jgi:hypothetical protein